MFDWAGVDREVVESVMAELRKLGPIGFRGPASGLVPDHLTVMDGDVKTAQLISPGDVCPSNALIA